MPAPRAFDLLRSCAPTISVGILAADVMDLKSDLALLEQADVKAIHFDVMDGCFVPLLTVGPPVVKAVRTRLLKDVHLMIREPLDKVADYVGAGADIVTVHVESGPDTRAVLRQLGTMKNSNDPERGLVRGVALNPGTPVEVLEPILDEVEMVTVLAVDPVERKPVFVESTGEKFSEVKQMVSVANREILLCIDGGVKKDNIAEIAAMGADIVVSGSAIFTGDSPAENVRIMMGALRSRIQRGTR
ncbi:MAG: ribulose-phosphate 3-epimerase [Candidatus Latescibacteria bacterium]|nr:ribulose-phosphate 3-epimerase [Candidatus Latescibacterota bacterium]NIM22644.1 ribulose-phosphate 3-epimerase [Candidatus Latescibacterota bacterium]NIM64933.1 ribulose-phosphate 3-epimerase [Candidatus Latescibacterota bacterium]NIO01448.1 ribulose-phosphate 3-epimerase [Candidatus Latescibacterota bacterium]NIO27958.1 ribulose-phosphate 3-epimerase [Candidatus Latescibacterota bacterium]